MTRYAQLQIKADKYHQKALNSINLDLKIFYLRVSRGYELKAKNLTIEQAIEIVK